MMTILHSITGSRSAWAPPSERSAWPSGTRFTIDDILIHGTSLTAAARAGRTPLVRIGEARAVWREGITRQEFVSVVVVHVDHVDHLGILQRPDIWIDATLTGCTPIVGAARIIGRPAAERRRNLRVLTESDPGSNVKIRIPADVRAGDLVAIPCSGTVALSQLVPHQRRPDIANPPVDADEVSDFYGRCGK